MRFTIALGVGLALLTASGASADKLKKVKVVNLPEVQEVTGAVEVTNLPEVQEVTGAIEVINLPDVQDVYVVNPPTPTTTQAGGPIQIVGVTSATYTGDLGGPWGAAEKCDAEFPGTRMCLVDEARLSYPPYPLIPTPGAWTNISGQTTGDDPFRSVARGDGLCLGWTFDLSLRGIVTRPDGGREISTVACSETIPIACCGIRP